jgi:peroxiredoxin
LWHHHLDCVHQRSQKINTKPRLLNFERYWKIVITPFLEKNFPLDDEDNAEEVERLLAAVIEEYPNVPTVDFEHTGPARIFLKTAPSPATKTYADRARAMLFEINHIVPGKPAPEIEGTDADGKVFRLSDYRGKVVLLTFSANWCGGCVLLYPTQRNLLKKFRQPFVILSVSRDKEIDTLKSSIASGEITWRCWWDGYDGPIRNAWNCRGIPNLFLLDRDHNIQDAYITRLSTQQEFEQAIESLLQKNAGE